jgi:hypothetical protein
VATGGPASRLESKTTKDNLADGERQLRLDDGTKSYAGASRIRSATSARPCAAITANGIAIDGKRDHHRQSPS